MTNIIKYQEIFCKFVKAISASNNCASGPAARRRRKGCEAGAGGGHAGPAAHRPRMAPLKFLFFYIP
jgi:hypothetical protein